MPRSAHVRTTLLLATTAGVLGSTVTPVAAAPPDDVIVLPGASSAEGIARGEDGTFYAGDLFRGDVFRGDLDEGTAELWIDAPDGRLAIGMAVDHRHDLLFVAGGFTGQAYVYDLDDGETVATYQLTPPSPAGVEPPTTLVNDVTVTRGGAWFTDSRSATLHHVAIGRGGELGEHRTLDLHGPAAADTGGFDLNGIATACGGRVLVVAHSGTGALYTVDPETGASAEIAGVPLPRVDGIVLAGRDLWAVQNGNQVTQVRLDDDLTTGRVVEVITDEDFQTPATAVRYDGRLAVVNAKFDTGIPPTADTYEIVLVDD